MVEPVALSNSTDSSILQYIAILFLQSKCPLSLASHLRSFRVLLVEQQGSGLSGWQPGCFGLGPFRSQSLALVLVGFQFICFWMYLCLFICILLLFNIILPIKHKKRKKNLITFKFINVIFCKYPRALIYDASVLALTQIWQHGFHFQVLTLDHKIKEKCC